MTNICYSGASKGADVTFGECAKRVGHLVTHFSFYGHKVGTREDVRILNALQLHHADKFLYEANHYLKRRWPTGSEYVNMLLERNYYQIRETQRIYAVSTIDSNGYVEGGTGWTIMMGILASVPEIYLYDVKEDIWRSFIHHDAIEDKIYWTNKEPPFPHDKYTGIGKFELPENGKQAILKLYNLL